MANWIGKDHDRLFLGAAGAVLFIKIFLKVLSASSKVDWSNFHDLSLAGTLFAVVLVYIGLLSLALHWSKILSIPASFIFLALPFFLYFLLLVNGLFFQLDDQAVLLGALGFFIAGIWFFRKDLNQKKAEASKPRYNGWEYGLISIFLLNGIFLFLGQNFTAGRVPYADENTFWYIAAQKMLSSGFLTAHQTGYPGGGLHPLGVPFLNAFPGMIVHLNSPVIPFFMPVYIIIGLTLVLLEFAAIQRSKWEIIFLLTALFACFNNRTWAGSLFYFIIYGESVCMVLVLSLLNWLGSIKKGSKASLLLVASFLLGLLALTKFPLILLSVPFFIAFIIRSWNEIRGIRILSLMIVVFFVPFLVLKIFQMKYGGAIGSTGGISLNKLFLPNTDMLGRVIHNISVDAKNLWYYFLIAAGLSIFTYKKWAYGWPVILWALFLIIYYAYIYDYGMSASGDAASGLRYFLPAAVGFICLGACGAGGVADIIKKQSNQFFRLGLYLVFISLILFKLF